MLVLVFLQVFSLAGVSQRTACIQIRTQYSLLWRKQLTRFCHEVHATHHHHLGVCLCSLASQRQRVANKVGYILYISYGIVVSQYNGIFLLTQSSNLFLQILCLTLSFRNVDGLIDESLLFPLSFQHHNIILFLFFFLLKREMIRMICR